MTVELIGVVVLFLGLISLFRPPSFVVYLFFASTLLGAAAAFILDSLGGTTIQPAHLLLGVLTIKLMSNREIRVGTLKAMAIGSPGFWLLITAIYAAITAYAMPRLFMGQTFTFAVRAEDYFAAPLVPTTSNLTQTIYFFGDCVCFLVLSGFGTTESGQKCLRNAALLCVILNLVFVVLDLATFATGTTELMSYIRNSTYGILNEHEIAGFKRIVGSFTEASVFGYTTLGYFAFASSLWLRGFAPRLTMWLSILSLVCLLFSTSTTAYVGVSVYLSIQYAIIVLTLLFRPLSLQQKIVLFCCPFIVIVVVLAVCLNDAASAYLGDLINTMVLNKMATQSGIERATWNNQAIQNFLDTYGFGAGNGSVRASSFVIAAIASLGFPGTITFALYFLTVWFRQNRASSPDIRATRTAAKFACFAWFIAATSAAAFIDLGLPFFSFAAVACADLSSRRARSPVAATPNVRIPVGAQI
jgi:hypothetical protein